nr:hypothetical protein [Tanacetum cinerariifolium]
MDPMYYSDGEEEEPSEDEEEEEKEGHLALDDSAISVPDFVPSAEEKEPFKTDEPQPPMVTSTKALIAEYASTPTPPSPSPSPLSPLSSPHPLITSPSLLLPSPTCMDIIPKADMPLEKMVRFIAPSHRFEIKESSEAATTRQTGPALTRCVDYGFIDTLDASIRATDERVMTALEEVDERMTSLAATYRHDSKEFYTRHQDTQDHQSILEARICTLRRERRYFRSMSLSYEREACYAYQA